MKRLIIFLLLFAAIKVAGQTTGYLRFDTVKIMKQNGTCELYLINKTKDSLGLLTNIGGGLTQFRKSRMLNDSTLVVGLDTLVIRGTGGSGGSSGLITLVRPPIEVFQGDSALGIPDTIALRIDPTGGLDTNPADTSLRIADLGVTTPRIDNLAVTTGKIADNAVTTAKILDANVTDAKLADMTGLSVKGRSASSTGVPGSITGTANQVLRVSSDGTTLGFGAVNVGAAAAITGLLPEDNLQAFKPWPAEYVWNTIYEKSSWPDLSDFSTLGTAVISLSSGYVNLTATTEDYTPRIVFKPEWATGLNYWKVTSRFKIIGFGSPSNWLGPFIKSLVNHDGANFGYQFFTGVGSGGGGNSFFTTENGSIISNPGAGSGVTKSLNDVLEFVMERVDTVLTFTVRNVTTSTTATPISYTFPAANTPNVLPNVGQWGVLLNSAGGTFQLQYLKIESAEKVAPNVLILGNSKTANGATSFNRRYAEQLNATYPTVTWSAGSAERMDPDMFYKRPELTFRNPEYVILGSVYDNDIRAGFAIQDVIDDMIKLENYWKGGGATVLWMAFPEDSTAGGASGLTAVRNWLVANRPDHYINTWDALRVSGSDNRLSDTYDAGDGVHINAAAHDLIVSTIIASGKVATISLNRRTSVRTKDLNSRMIGDSLAFPFDFRRTANNILKVNSTYDVTSSLLWDNGTNAIVTTSIQPTAPHASSRLSVDGLFSLYGTAAAYRLYGRSVTTDFFEFYHNSSTLYLGFGGVDGMAWGTKANLRIGRMTGISNSVMFPYFQIQGTNTFASSAQGHNGLIARLDSNVIHYTGAGTGLGDVTGTSVGHDAIMATNTTNADTASSFTFRGAPRDSTNFTSTVKLAGYVRDDKWVFGGRISILKRGLTLYSTNATRQMLVVDTVTGDVDRMDIPSPGGGGITSINSETGPGITIAAGTGISVNTTTNTVTVSANPNYELYYSDNSSTTVANTTSETTLYGTGAGTAEFTNVTAGSVLTLKGSGTISTAASPGTPELGLHIGNYTLGMSLTSLTGALSNVFFDYHFEIIPVGTGSSQDIMVYCKVNVHETVTTIRSYTFTQRSSASFTTTGTPDANVTIEWSAADPANSVTGHKNTVEIYRK